MAIENTPAQGTAPVTEEQVIQLFLQGLHHGVEAVGFKTSDIASAAGQIRAQGASGINAHDTKIFLSTMIDTISATADANQDRKITGIELYALTGNIAEHANQWFQQHVNDPEVLQLLQENISVNMERAENALIATNLDRGAVVNPEAMRCVMANLVDVADAADTLGIKMDNAIHVATGMEQVASVAPLLRTAVLHAVGQCGAIITQAPDTGGEFSSGIAHLPITPDPGHQR